MLSSFSLALKIMYALIYFLRQSVKERSKNTRNVIMTLTWMCISDAKKYIDTQIKSRFSSNKITEQILFVCRFQKKIGKMENYKKIFTAI